MNASSWSFNVNNTDTTSSLKVSGPKGSILEIGDITISSPIKAISAANTQLMGDLEIDEGISQITLGDIGSANVGGGELIDIYAGPGAANPIALTFGIVNGATLESDLPISSLTATSWFDSTGNEYLETPGSAPSTSRALRSSPGLSSPISCSHRPIPRTASR